MITIFNARSLQHSFLMLSLLLLTETTSAQEKFKVHCVMVEKAQIARHSLAKEGEFSRANYGHQIAAGKRSVLAIRVYKDEDKGPDSQYFEKATLEFKSPKKVEVGKEIAISALRSYYSEGASGWVADGGYSWAVNPFPHFRIRQGSSGLHVTLKAVFDVTSASLFFPGRKHPVKVDVECPVVQKTVMELTPWVGRVGTNWLSFYIQE